MLTLCRDLQARSVRVAVVEASGVWSLLSLEVGDDKTPWDQKPKNYPPPLETPIARSGMVVLLL